MLCNCNTSSCAFCKHQLSSKLTVVNANRPARGLEIGAVYRFGDHKTGRPDLEFVDGKKNWFFYTDSPNESDRGLRFQAGIWNPKKISIDGEERVPIIICSSSPHQVGSYETPWSDVIRPDDGFATYYGDNKDPENRDALAVRGNRLLVEAMRQQHSLDRRIRMQSPPVLVISTRDETGPSSGYKMVEGIGVVKQADLVLQRSEKTGEVFQNIRFDLIIFDLKEDQDFISMDWINARRNSQVKTAEAHEFAPKVWKEFVDRGIGSVETMRRRVMRTYVREEAAQKPALGSPLEDILLKTIDHFAHTKHDFEAVAARVVERIFIDQGVDYRTGWITPKSGDGGYDFVGCIDLDRNGGFPSSRQVVLGQAKCEQSATSGRDIARLAARLRRGWQGAYVTTSTFSRKVQEEVLVDKFPILLVPGMRVATIVKDELDQTGSTLSDYLSKIMSRYRALPRGHDPESVIFN